MARTKNGETRGKLNPLRPRSPGRRNFFVLSFWRLLKTDVHLHGFGGGAAAG